MKGEGEGKAEDKIERKPTSIKIDPELWEEAKIVAIKQKMLLSELVEQAVRKELAALRGKNRGVGDYYSEG
jgi:predicted HicB family RNase H-like nuclease